MHHRHFHDQERCGHGPFGRRWEWYAAKFGGGYGAREGRVFDSGELKLVILALIAEKPVGRITSTRTNPGFGCCKLHVLLADCPGSRRGSGVLRSSMGRSCWS